MLTATRRWTRTLTGFAGFGGLSWLSSVLTSGTRPRSEDLPYDAIAGRDTRYLTVQNQPVAYREIGEGETTVLFIHGFGGRLETWAPMQEALASRYRTVAIDLWGFGASSRPARLTPKDWTAQVFNVLNALKIDRAVFAAHSLGGRVSLLCRQHAPERVRGLFLCDCDWGQAAHGYYLAWGIAFTPAMANLLSRLRGNREHLRALLNIAYSAHFAVDDSLMARSHDPIRVLGSEEAYISLARANPMESIPRNLQQVTCPVQVVWGENDGIIPVDWATPLMRMLPNAELTVLPNCAHCPQDEQPEAVTAQLLRLLARVEAS